MKTESMLTVVVPMYNVSPYLQDCLDTLDQQTIANLKVILVDDGSTDLTGDIAINFCKDRDDFTYVKKVNGGLSSARNYGLKLVRTKYVAFLDSDDWVSSEMYNELVKTAEEHESEIVACGMNLVYENNVVVPYSLEKQKIKVETSFIRAFQAMRVAAWDKVYLTKLFKDNGICYPEGLYFEDTPTTTSLLLMSKSVSIIPDCFYYYRQRSGSITKSSQFEEKYLDIFLGLKQAKNKFIDIIGSDDLFTFVRYKKGILDSIIRMSKYKQVKPELIAQVRGEISLMELIKISMDFFHKVTIFSFLLFPRFTLSMLRLKK
ncbi:glycosyltransferase [Vibrio sp. NC2]|uniref:glycosyltransferase n=1 Tax=Vibrio sp. NC2 TaxID=2974562 RepID=UPI0021A67943|nr:glycosyltransferase [Vibrio sp. NC2]MCT4349530.1 glycosyltransferase [Vibrio sp. NC2]